MATRSMVGFTPPCGLDLVVEDLDPAVVGQEVVVEAVHRVTVHDSRPVHGNEVLWSDTITLDATELILPITLPTPVPYAWDGPQVTVDVVVTLKVPKSGWFSKDEVLAEAIVPLPRIARSPSPRDGDLMAPRDHWSIELAIQSLGPDARSRVVTQLALYGTGVLGGLVVAWWTSFCFLYFVWIVASLIAGKLVYDKVMKELAGYASLEWGFVPPLAPDSRIPIGKLLGGTPRVDVVRPRLRIVACNLERGQYRRGSGTDVRTVSFSEPIGAVVLYDRELPRWSAGVRLDEAFDGDVDFGPAFQQLAPPAEVGSDHGIGLRWEAQLVVPELVDVELEGPVEIWHWPADWSPGS